MLVKELRDAREHRPPRPQLMSVLFRNSGSTVDRFRPDGHRNARRRPAGRARLFRRRRSASAALISSGGIGDGIAFNREGDPLQLPARTSAQGAVLRVMRRSGNEDETQNAWSSLLSDERIEFL